MHATKIVASHRPEPVAIFSEGRPHFSLDDLSGREDLMPRIPDELLERIKAEVPIERLAERAGVALRPHGENLLGLCCFHEDKSPSLVVTPAKNLWHCMGACQAGGSAIDWVMKERDVSFRAAA